MPADFAWHTAGDDIVFPTMEAVAIYLNENGDLVIRQEATEMGERDQVVVIPMIFVERLIAKIQVVVRG